MKEIINLSIDAAKEAGSFILKSFGKIKKIEAKGDRNFATDVDKTAEEIIIDKIKRFFPDHGILAEESGDAKNNSDWLWIIDPLDGTHNFMRNINVFGVSIGIVYKNKFVAGVVYMPVTDELYVGEKANGAYCNNQRIYVSKENDFKNFSISFDSSIRYLPEPMLEALGKLSKEVFNVRMFGSSARQLTYLAQGILDAVVEFHDSPWDFAGSVALIQEAGGVITAFNGGELTTSTVGYVASNGMSHQELLQMVSTKK